MKRFVKKAAFAAGFMVFGLALGLSGLAWANEGELTLEQQLSELTLTLKEVFLENPSPKQQAPNDYAPNPQEGPVYNEIKDKFGCIVNYQSWPHSEEFKQTDKINMNFAMTEMESLSDVNGDGLSDYIYINHSNNYQKNQCIYLNHGRGFDLEYRCVARWGGNPDTWTYYGDCAEI